MNLQQQEQFYQMMTRLNANSRSRAASSKDDVRITEMVDGTLVSKPAKKIEHLSTQEQQPQAQAKVWNLTKDGPVLQSKGGSVQENKLKVIQDFIRSNGRV